MIPDYSTALGATQVSDCEYALDSTAPMFWAIPDNGIIPEQQGG